MLFVSIPFRADTGFERHNQGCRRLQCAVSIPFRADTGFEHRRLAADGNLSGFQSLSGLTLGLNPLSWNRLDYPLKFQSLSGLTLGLND